jgi:hypothetical protein
MTINYQTNETNHEYRNILPIITCPIQFKGSKVTLSTYLQFKKAMSGTVISKRTDNFIYIHDLMGALV